MTDEKLKQIIKDQTKLDICVLKPVGQGCVGKVYYCKLENGQEMAIKFAANSALMQEEYQNLNYISERVDFKLPNVFFTYSDKDNQNIIAMQYFNGKNANERQFLKMPRKNKAQFVKQVVENLKRLQSVTNPTFGAIDAPNYATWLDYYMPFALHVLDAAEQGAKQKKIPKRVVNVMRIAVKQFDCIFDEPICEAVLTHGDYWLPNMIVDEKTMELLGVVDPFNLLYADKEYDLFPFIAANGNRYGLLDAYKSEVKTSVKCDLKIELYALFSEIYWFTKTEHIYKSFVLKKARLLKKQLKRFNIPLRF